MDTLTSLAIVTLAALVHASFQLSVSVLTLLSGHALGAKKSQTRVLSLTSSFVFGAGVMTVLLLSLISYVFFHLFGSNTPLIIWAIVCGLLVGVGLSVWVFYYRRGKGTSLWIPRSLARHLSDRSKATKDPAEAFSLGLTSVIAEILFIIAPLSVAALVLVQLSPVWQFAGIVLYTKTLYTILANSNIDPVITIVTVTKSVAHAEPTLLHQGIIFFCRLKNLIQIFFCDLEFLYTFDLSHSRRSRGRTEKMGTKVTQILHYLQNIIDIETQFQKSSV